MARPEVPKYDEAFHISLREKQLKLGKDPMAPSSAIPLKHFQAIVYENWSDAQELIERKGVLVTATTFKMDRDMQRHEVLRLGKPAVVIIGSFRFKSDIDEAIDAFTESGINVLMPPKGSVKGSVRDFPLLEDDSLLTPPEMIEDLYVQKLQAADVAYIINPGGYIGDMSTLEIGLAMCRGVPIYSSQPIALDAVSDEATWKGSMGLIKSYSVASVAEMTCRDALDTDDYPWFRPWNNQGTYRPAPNLDEMALGWAIDSKS